MDIDSRFHIIDQKLEALKLNMDMDLVVLRLKAPEYKKHPSRIAYLVKCFEILLYNRKRLVDFYPSDNKRFYLLSENLKCNVNDTNK